MRELPLIGTTAIARVDDRDYDLAALFPWRLNANGYVCFAQRDHALRKKKMIFLHRLLLKAPDCLKVDHIDMDPLNNLRLNLRLCTFAGNAQNRVMLPRRLADDRYTEFKGIDTRDGLRWTARISHDGRRRSLGTFASPVLAAFAYDIAARSLFGEFARLNFPREGEQSASRSTMR